MSTSRPLPPGRRAKGARPPAATMRALPEPRLLRAPPAPAFPVKKAPELVEQPQKAQLSRPHDVAAGASAPASPWEQRALKPTEVAKPADQPAPPARIEAPVPSPVRSAPPKASGFLAARAMFDAKRAAASLPAPPPKPSRFNVRPPIIATGGCAHVQADAPSTPKSAVPVPEPPTEQAPSSVKALISRLNSPAAAAKAAKPLTEHPRPGLSFSPVNRVTAPAAIGAQQPEQRTPPRQETTTPEVKRAPTPEPIVSGAKPAAVVEPLASTRSSPPAQLSTPPVRAPAPPAPRSAAPPLPIAAPPVRPVVMTPPVAAPPVPPTIVTAPAPTVSPRPTVTSPSAHSPVPTDSATTTPEFHPFNLLLPVTAVPTIPRRLDCVYDDAAAEMQRNVMKVVKKLFRKHKPRVEEFKINAKLYGNGFMDAEEYLDSLIKEFCALRALQLVPCLVSIQPDAIKRENLLFAARGYRLRNLEALYSQCEQAPSGTAFETRLRLSSSESAASTVSTVSTVSVAVETATSVIVKDHEQEKKLAVAFESVVAAVGLSSTEQLKPEPLPSPPEEKQEATLRELDSSRVDVQSSASKHEVMGNNTVDSSSLTTTEPHTAEPVSDPIALASESLVVFSKVEPDEQNELPAQLQAAKNNYKDGSTEETPVPAPADMATCAPATTEDTCEAELAKVKVENALSEADTDSDSSAADPVALPSTNVAAPGVSSNDQNSPFVRDVVSQEEEEEEMRPSPRDSNQDLLSQSSPQGTEPEAALSTEEEAAAPQKPGAETEQLTEVPTKPLPKAAGAARSSRADSLTSSEDEEEEDASPPSKAFQRNMFGEVVALKKHQAKQQVDCNDAGKPAATTDAAAPAYYEAESLFGGSYEPVVAVQASTSTSAISVDTTDAADAFSLFGPASATSSPARSPSSSRPRKSVTWGANHAKEIPARKSSPPPAPMIFGLATAGAYSDSDDSDFD